jgi:glutathione-dependent formaldehyde-activating enzyme
MPRFISSIHNFWSEMSLRRVPRPTRNGVGASPCSTFLTTCLAKPSPQRASDFGVVARAPSSGHRIRFHFCPNCGSTLYWEGERNPPVYAVAVGAFDRSAFLPPATRSGRSRCIRAQPAPEDGAPPAGATIDYKSNNKGDAAGRSE